MNTFKEFIELENKINGEFYFENSPFKKYDEGINESLDKELYNQEQIVHKNAQSQANKTNENWIIYKTPKGTLNTTRKSVWDNTSETTKNKNKIIKIVKPTQSTEINSHNKAAKIISHKIEYDEDEYGNKIRKWGHGDIDHVKDEDVKTWLSGNRVIEDLKTGLEHVRPEYIKQMINNDYLRKDEKHGYYWITKKAADKFKLKPVMGKNFPK